MARSNREVVAALKRHNNIIMFGILPLIVESHSCTLGVTRTLSEICNNHKFNIIYWLYMYIATVQ